MLQPILPEQPPLPRLPRTVLIVEDEPSVREILVETFELEGFTVLEAENGDEALLLSARHSDTIELLISDISLPTMDGQVLANRMQRQVPELQVLFITGFASAQIAGNGAPVLQKPFTITQLVETVEQIRDSRRQPVS